MLKANALPADWTTVKLMKAMVNEVEKTIKERPELAYKGNADFVADAVRKELDRLAQRDIDAARFGRSATKTEHR